MNWLWTWGGVSFGYRDGDDLRTHDGRFQGEEVYGPDGRYLGELQNGDRLITNRSKLSYNAGAFTPFAAYAGYARYADYAGYAMYAGYQDFPAPEDLP